MELNQVIKKPILTEKTYRLMDKGVYTFAVNKHANKYWVKHAVEFIFAVKVKNVNIIKIEKKAKKLGRFAGFSVGYKKVIVTLSEGTINLFPEDAATKQDKKDDSKAQEVTIKEKDVEVKTMSDAEKRAAKKIAKVNKAKSEVKDNETKEEVIKVGQND